MATQIKAAEVASTKFGTIDQVSPKSNEIVLALSGLAGAGCSAIARQMETLLSSKGYQVHIIKMSAIIADKTQQPLPDIVTGTGKGQSTLHRAIAMQNAGDSIRSQYGDFALSSFAIKKISDLRGSYEAGKAKIAYIVDSLKHPDEVDLFRRVYDSSFKLMAVHCNKENRDTRLFGEMTGGAKFAGAEKSDFEIFIARDEDDSGNSHGQHVKDVFHQADFFLDNSVPYPMAGAIANPELDRFFDLILNNKIYRPTVGEKAIYHAFGAALQSSCLSRQVGACLVSPSGEIISIGTNDPPRFGGGVYGEGSSPDARCHKFEFSLEGGAVFIGCHNDRKKAELVKNIYDWTKNKLIPSIAQNMKFESDVENRREKAEKLIVESMEGLIGVFDAMPGIRSLIEFSRSIHAEMDAILSAGRDGRSTVGCDLYVTTYPCHSCARHLVAAGIRNVYFVEPYTKSLAMELHRDAIIDSLPSGGADVIQQMTIVPFTGVGPSMFRDSFLKKVELKHSGGGLNVPDQGLPDSAVRLSDLKVVETRAIELASESKAPAND